MPWLAGLPLFFSLAMSAGPDAGISEALARDRAARISALRYDVSLDIPASVSQGLTGKVQLRFSLSSTDAPLVVDFAPGADSVHGVAVNEKTSRWSAANGHIVIPADVLRRGANAVAIDFAAGGASLNRNAEYLYTLFVPARAHLAIPCFDQPDLKARFSLTLSVPGGWEAVSNGAETERRTESDGRVALRFAETQPLSTYLFAFAAGKWQIETAERNGRTFRMFHRETDAAKVKRNRDAIFDLHAAALRWMEEYTGIPYAFGKFDFVAVPAFQFGGMEHAGSVWYRAPSLFLEESASQAQQLGRASLIAHETAHMWFGDLVTMKWFNDVWLKEVFANFMAAKIVNPSFPNLNHELRFFLNHFAAAYSIDRTDGANAIRQPLENLKDAGTLYGPIVYQKSPILMRNLERLIGEQPFREGIRRYLRSYSFSNAVWADLIAILDQETPEDLVSWSKAWIDQPGRPRVRTQLRVADGMIEHLSTAEDDPQGKGRNWGQRLTITLGYAGHEEHIDASRAKGRPAPLYVLPNGQGVGYGEFRLDAASRQYLTAHLAEVKDALSRACAWSALWDAMLNREVTARDLLKVALTALSTETDELNVARFLSDLRSLYWRYVSVAERWEASRAVEQALRDGIQRAPTRGIRVEYYRAFRDVVSTPEGTGWLRQVWAGEAAIAGLPLEEVDKIAMATELALREVDGWREILAQQLEKTGNADRKAQLAFVIPALDADPEVRARFFASLRDVANRAHEPWVLEAVSFLNHPLRASSSEKFIPQALAMLEDIQRTGDIFFPKGWLDATLRGHRSAGVRDTLRAFVASLPRDYPQRLRLTLLASGDDLLKGR